MFGLGRKQSLLQRRPPRPEAGQEIVRLEGVSKAFGTNHVLRDLDLSLRHGETTVILGRSGTGKSVLLKTIIGLLRPDAGRVVVMGQDVTAMSQADLEPLRLCVGMLFQGGALFDSLTVGENIAYPIIEKDGTSYGELRPLIARKLKMVALEGIEDLKPAEISGGMQKRVALARAIATEPDVILYDEPTTGLDPRNANRINQLIRRLQELLGVTSIVVTHDMHSAFYVSDRIAMLYDRRIGLVDTVERIRSSRDSRVVSFIEGRLDSQDLGP